ncbi:MAG: TraB/GumN family protein [Candidatus Parabeggiatoa sp. nov. 1]|nr:MAG: TraB/GumN family protein [Gammaproteobacteria bacterium]
MKQFYRRAFWLITLFLVILMAPNLFADETLSQKGLLWQIDRQGLTPSYLFGTIHSEDARVNQLPHDVRSRFEQADSVSLEVLMDIPTMLKVAHAMFFMGDKSLDKLIGKNLYNQVVKAMSKYDMPSMVVKKLKPWAVIVTLSTPPSKTGEVLDLRLYRKARQLQIPTYGLEKVEEQLNIFEDIPLDDQVTLLKDTLEYLDKMPIIFDKLHELYLERDLTALMTFSAEYMRDSSDNQALMDAFYKRIVDDRNSRMVKRMEKRLREGNAFIAVGALHLPGKKGLLKLLQTRGYRVSALY